MSRLCWIFVLLAVVVPLSSARPHKCEQRERSLADLDLAEEALRRAKQLYPSCEEENEISNSSECSKKDKSLGLIDVALDLVSSAKRNMPIAPFVPTEEPLDTTEDLSNKVKTDRRRPMDCEDLQNAGIVRSGVYRVWPLKGKTVRVLCDMDTDGGGWTFIQRRGNFSKQENFNRDWQSYKNGFGSLERDFWLGNDHIFALTNQGTYSLRMDMTAVDGESAYALYREFRIEDDNANYKLHVDGYSGTAGDCMTDANGDLFTTKDKNNYIYNGSSSNCAEMWKGAWWYTYCALCNPNGLYRPGHDSWSTMFYDHFRGNGTSSGHGLFSMEMKVKKQ